MKPRQPRQDGGVSGRTTPRLITLHDVMLLDADGDEKLAINGEELTERFRALARWHRWPKNALLANRSVVKGQKLVCRLVDTLPDATHWLNGNGKYITTKLLQTPVVAGLSFAYVDNGGTQYAGGSRSHLKRSASVQSAPASPPPAKRHSQGESGGFEEFSMSPDTPGGGAKGRTHPRLLDLHRAAALAASKDPSACNKADIRHICGNPRCAVIFHFRPGTKHQNDKDTAYHKAHPNRAPQSFPPWQ